MTKYRMLMIDTNEFAIWSYFDGSSNPSFEFRAQNLRVIADWRHLMMLKWKTCRSATVKWKLHIIQSNRFTWHEPIFHGMKSNNRAVIIKWPNSKDLYHEWLRPFHASVHLIHPSLQDDLTLLYQLSFVSRQHDYPVNLCKNERYHRTDCIGIASVHCRLDVNRQTL